MAEPDDPHYMSVVHWLLPVFVVQWIWHCMVYDRNYILLSTFYLMVTVLMVC